MTTYDGVAITPATGDASTRVDASGASFPGAGLQVNGSPAPFIQRGGSLALAPTAGPVVGTDPLSGDSWNGTTVPLAAVLVTGRLDVTGQAWLGVSIVVSAVYRNGDRTTLAGYAKNQAGQPLRQFQIQFEGQTVQDHFFGAGTDLNGVYVAYVDTGDSYDAFAFSPTTGITYRLVATEVLPNQTNLTFRQVTKRGAFGEGIFLQGGA